MIDVLISYNIFAKIYVAIEADARDRDYDVVRNRIDINKLINEFKFVNYICDRNMIYKERFIKRIRNINNIKTNCSWKFKLNYYIKSNRWKTIVVNTWHNHEFFNEINVHLIHRRNEMTKIMLHLIDTKNKIDILINIFNEIEINNFDTLITIQNIYNAEKKFRYIRLSKYTSTQILFKILQRNNWFTKIVLKNKINRVKKNSSSTNTWKIFLMIISKLLWWIVFIKLINKKCYWW